MELTNPDPASLLTLREVAELMRWSIDSVRSRVRTGQLPHFRFAGGSSAIRIARQDLIDYISKHHVTAGTSGGNHRTPLK